MHWAARMSAASPSPPSRAGAKSRFAALYADHLGASGT
jgi:hypothetical protein